MTELFWGLFHWEYRKRWYYRDGVHIELSRWRRVWDQKADEGYEEAGKKLESDGWKRVLYPW